MRSFVATAALLVVALFGLGPSVAQGQPSLADRREAQQLLDRGYERFRAGEYDAARPLFEAADRLVPHPNNKWNIALCLHGAGHVERALAAYQVVVDHDEDPERRERASQSIKKIRDRYYGHLAVRCLPEGARWYLEQEGVIQAEGICPALGEYLLPGRYQVRLEAGGYLPAILTAEISAGASIDRTRTLDPAPAEATGAPFPWHLAALGGTVLATGLGAYLGLQARAAEKDARGTLDPDVYDRADERLQTSRRYANVSWGAAALGAGITAYLWPRSGAADGPTVGALPLAGAGGTAGLSLRGSF